MTTEREGGAPPPGGHRIHVVEDFISSDDIARAIDCIEKSVRSNRTEAYQDIPQVRVVPDTDPEANALIAKYSSLLIAAHKARHGFVADLYTSQAQLCFWPEGSSAQVHFDSHLGYEHVTFSSVIYLNDDFEGGEIHFPHQAVTFRPRRGQAILFPSGGHEHRHGVREITRGGRFTISMFHGIDSKATWDTFYSRTLRPRFRFPTRLLAVAVVALDVVCLAAWWSYGARLGTAPLFPLLAASLAGALFAVAFVRQMAGEWRWKHVALLVAAFVQAPLMIWLASR